MADLGSTVDLSVVYVCFHNDDYALGYRYAEALRKRGFIVVRRPYPGSADALAYVSVGGRSLTFRVPDCLTTVVILTPAWSNEEPPEPHFLEFQTLAENDWFYRRIYVVRTASIPLPPILEDLDDIDDLEHDPDMVAEVIHDKLLHIVALANSTAGLTFAVSKPMTAPEPPGSIPGLANVINVFISYAHADQNFEQRLLRDLQAAGIKPWVDHERLQSGTPDWEITVRRGIEASDALIYVGTPEALASINVRSELTIAHDNGVPIHAIWANGTTWSSCAPFRLVPSQYEDARGPKYASAVQSLIACLKQANSNF